MGRESSNNPSLRTSILALILWGCSPLRSVTLSTRPVLVMGQTTPAELAKKLGAPVRTYHPQERTRAEVQVYPDARSFQIEEGKVVAEFRDPDPVSTDQDESSLQYWMHRWKGKNTQLDEVPHSKDRHGRSLFILREVESRTAVIFDSAKGEVIRVVQYGN